MPLHQVLLTPRAREELQEAWDYLNQQRTGLGDAFLEEFTKTTDLLLTFPELYETVRGDIRRGIIHRFRYVFTYVIQDDTLVIARITYAGRNTEYY